MVVTCSSTATVVSQRYFLYFEGVVEKKMRFEQQAVYLAYHEYAPPLPITSTDKKIRRPLGIREEGEIVAILRAFFRKLPWGCT